MFQEDSDEFYGVLTITFPLHPMISHFKFEKPIPENQIIEKKIEERIQRQKMKLIDYNENFSQQRITELKILQQKIAEKSLISNNIPTDETDLSTWLPIDMETVEIPSNKILMIIDDIANFNKHPLFQMQFWVDTTNIIKDDSDNIIDTISIAMSMTLSIISGYSKVTSYDIPGKNKTFVYVRNCTITPELLLQAYDNFGAIIIKYVIYYTSEDIDITEYISQEELDKIPVVSLKI